MADSEELRRLVLHAADRLAQENGNPRLVEAIANETFTDRKRAMARELRSQVAAMALAEATLRMVAACMAVEEPGPSARPAAVRDEKGRFTHPGGES